MHNHCFTPHLWVAQHSHSEKRHQLTRFYLNTNITFFTLFFWSIRMQNTRVAQCPRQPISAHSFARRQGHRQNPHVLLHKISTSSHNPTVLGVPPVQLLHCSPLTGTEATTRFYSQILLQLLGKNGQLSQSISGNKNQKSQECGREQPRGEDALIWSHRQD